MAAVDGAGASGPPAAVLAGFGLDPEAPASVLAGGHIHRNYLVGPPGRRAVVQRLNDSVFPRPEAVVSNGQRIVAALRAAGRPAPEPLPGPDGGAGCHHRTGWWRAWWYLEQTVARPVPGGPDDARSAAAAFADYAGVLASLPPPPLEVTIADFHHLGRRLEALDAAGRRDRLGRRPGCRRELEATAALGATVAGRLAAHDLPRRVAHNDAKMANVRFDLAGGPPVVLDYDTTMVGTVLADVGELLRTATVAVPEDHPRPDEVVVDAGLVAAVADGYRAGGPALDRAERAAVAMAGPWLAVENAARFLADHLDGDRYFAVQRPGQNLARCRVQLAVARQLLDQADAVGEAFARGR